LGDTAIYWVRLLVVYVPPAAAAPAVIAGQPAHGAMGARRLE